MLTSKSSQQVADMIDSNHMLEGISYDRRESTTPTTALKDLPHQEQLSANDESMKYSNLNQSSDKPLYYPAPLPSYNPKKCPADLDKADKHGFAHTVSSYEKAGLCPEECESTGVPVVTKKPGFFCSMDRLYHLGPVVPMYFLFLKQLGIIFFLMASMAVAVTLLNEDVDYNTLDYKEAMSNLANSDKQVYRFVFSLFAVCLLFAMLLYLFRKYQKVTKMNCKKSVITPSDYTVMATQLGRVHIEEEIQAFFSNYIVLGHTLQICKVAISYDISNFAKKIRRLKELIEEKKEAEKVANYISSGVVENIQKQIDEINQFFNSNKKLLAGYKGFKRNGTAFITFVTKQEAKSVRRKFEFSGLERAVIWFLEKCTDEFPEYFFKDHYLKVEKAPELKEIIWENLNCNTTNKCFTFSNFLLHTVIIALSTVSIYFLQQANIAYMSYLIGLVIAVYNEVLSGFIFFLASYDNFKTITHMNISIQKRIAFWQFINTAFPVYLLNYVLLSNTAVGTFALNVFAVVAVTCAFPLLIRLLNFSHMAASFRRSAVRRQAQSNSRSGGVTQETANHAHEKPEFNIVRFYGDATRVLLISCFYFSVSPAIPLVGLAYVFLSYMIDKYNLLNKSLTPSSMRSEMAEAMIEIMDYSLLLLAIGGNVFLNLLTNQMADKMTFNRTISIITIILAAVYLVLPHKRFARNCFPVKKEVSWSNILFYQQAAEGFINDYQTSGPIRKDLDPTNRGKEIELNRKTFEIKRKDEGLPRDQAKMTELRQTFKKSMNQFQCIEVLSEYPELLPLFDYVRKRPVLADCGSGEYRGLRNPYYIFPQNYGYAYLYNQLREIHEKTSMKTPLMYSLQPSPTRESDTKHSNKNVVRMNELAVSKNTSSPDDSKEKSGPAATAKGGSLMKDIMMIPSLPNHTPVDLKGFAMSPNLNSIRSPHFGMDLEGRRMNTFGEPGPSFIDGAGLMDAVSPISTGVLGRNIDGISPITGNYVSKFANKE